MKIANTRKIAITAIMSAMAALLMFIELPLPFFPSFLKMDISDLPAVIIAFAAGPIWGVAVELIKNIIHMTTTKTGFVGEAANFLVGGAFVLTAGVFYKQKHTRKGAIISLAAGTLSMIIMGIIVNYYIILPFYSKIMPFDAIISLSAKANTFIVDKLTLILYGISPFNALKGIILSVVTLLIYKPLSPILHRSIQNKTHGS